jgi:hypothetical protein
VGEGSERAGAAEVIEQVEAEQVVVYHSVELGRHSANNDSVRFEKSQRNHRCSTA